MALRNIRKDGDEILRKRSREVEEIDEKILTLLDDMAQTMYEANGVGLAAVQVGVLKRVIVIDTGEGLIELINPEITKTKGRQKEIEGCLSIEGKCGEVVRPMEVTVKAQDRNGEVFELTGDKLLARAICHEVDHLEGILFTDIAERIINNSDLEEEN